MKNIQVIDGAENCAYSIFAVSDRTYFLIFPEKDQDVEFITCFVRRLGKERAESLLAPVWKRRLEKSDIVGIHGTFFFELDFKKKYYPNRMDADLDQPPRAR